jgi:integrase
MDTTYDVRIWKTDVYKGARTTTYKVRWAVAGRPWKRPFKTDALADAFRSELVTAARRGEAFDVESGIPVSMLRAGRDVGWLDFAMQYVDAKWSHLAPNSRRNTARALTSATMAMLTTDRGKPADANLRRALAGWAFNTRARETRAMSEGVIVNFAEFAVERKLLDSNPITSLAWKAPKTVKVVDKRVVVNPEQARDLLTGVRNQLPSGPRLVALLVLLGRQGRAALGEHVLPGVAERKDCVPDGGAGSSPLAARPYDLRHAAVSTWLNAGVPPTQVAEWAGHSVAVLLQIYAKCLDGQEELARTRIAAALDSRPAPARRRPRRPGHRPAGRLKRGAAPK